MTTDTLDQAKLHDVLVAAFSLDEIKTLAFDLGLLPDDLPGETVSAKARALILASQQQNLLPQMLNLVQQKRPGLHVPQLVRGRIGATDSDYVTVSFPESFKCPKCLNIVTIVELDSHITNEFRLTDEEYRFLLPKMTPNLDDTWNVSGYIVCRTCGFGLDLWRKNIETYVRDGYTCPTCEKPNHMRPRFTSAIVQPNESLYLRHVTFRVECSFCDTSQIRKALVRSLIGVKALVFGKRTSIVQVRKE